MLALCFVSGMCFSKEATFSIFVGKRGERERKVPESRLQIAAAFFSYLYLYLFRDTFVQVKKRFELDSEGGYFWSRFGFRLFSGVWLFCLRRFCFVGFRLIWFLGKLD